MCSANHKLANERRLHYQSDVAQGNEDDQLGIGDGNSKESQQLHVLGPSDRSAGTVFSQTATAVTAPVTDYTGIGINDSNGTGAVNRSGNGKRSSRGGYEELDSRSEDSLPQLSASAEAALRARHDDRSAASTRALLELHRMHREAERLSGQQEGFGDTTASGTAAGNATPKVLPKGYCINFMTCTCTINSTWYKLHYSVSTYNVYSLLNMTEK